MLQNINLFYHGLSAFGGRGVSNLPVLLAVWNFSYFIVVKSLFSIYPVKSHLFVFHWDRNRGLPYLSRLPNGMPFSFILSGCNFFNISWPACPMKSLFYFLTCEIYLSISLGHQGEILFLFYPVKYPDISGSRRDLTGWTGFIPLGCVIHFSNQLYFI